MRMQIAAESYRFALLECRILLAGRFDAGQDSYAHQHDSAGDDPMGRDVHQAGTVDEAGDHDQKPGDVDSE